MLLIYDCWAVLKNKNAIMANQELMDIGCTLDTNLYEERL